MMEASSALHVHALLHSAGLAVWIGGGWGIDALVGRQTRVHRDLDLMHDAAQESDVLAVLGAEGYRETLDARPVRFVLAHDNGTVLDLHPLRFASDGSAVQAADDNGATFHYPADCFVFGHIEGSKVACLSAAQQIYFHQGYEPMEQDLHDMALLRTEFGLKTHF